MARASHDNALAKRDFIHSDRVTTEQKNAGADAFIADERYGEALEFLEITRDAGRLETILGRAVEAGDTFLLLRVEKIRGEEIPAATWRDVGERALRIEKNYDAMRAFERAGDEERATRIREERMPGYEPWKPEGK